MVLGDNGYNGEIFVRMKQPPVLLVLEKMDVEERQAFGLFLESPLSGATPLAHQLWQALNTPPVPEDPEAFYPRLWPDQPYKAQRLRRVFMELHQCLRQFISFRATQQKSDLVRELDYLRFLLDHGAYGLFAKALARTWREVPRLERTDRDHQYHLSRLHRMENEYRIHQGADEDSFEAVARSLDRFFLANQLELQASMLTREKRFPQRHQFPFADEVNRMVERAPLDEWPEVRIWAQVCALEAPESPRRAYDELAQSLGQFAGQMPLLYLRQVRGYQFNYLLRHLRPNHKEDYRELWELARTMTEEGTILLQNRLSQPFLRAAVQSACYAGEAEWARTFLDEMGQFLVGEDRSQVLAFHRLLVAYYQGDYGRVKKGSVVLEKGSARQEVLLRVLLLKTYYDLGEVEEFFRLAEAFRRLLERKGHLGQRFAEGYAAFVRFAERLGRSRFDGEKVPVDLKEEIMATFSGEKLWLLEQLERLGK